MGGVVREVEIPGSRAAHFQGIIQALFAFLHVDTVYSTEGDAHAEALYHLVQVWQDLKKFDRMQETRRILEDQYKENRWCKALGK